MLQRPLLVCDPVSDCVLMVKWELLKFERFLAKGKHVKSRARAAVSLFHLEPNQSSSQPCWLAHALWLSKELSVPEFFLNIA